MLSIKKDKLISTIKKMVLDANFILDKCVVDSIRSGLEKETSALAKNVLENILENSNIAAKENIPLCQDTGVAVFFLEVGNELFFDYSLEEAINEAVALAYQEGYLRKSMVSHPLRRINTLDNTPSIIHIKLVMGSTLSIHFAPKGGGSENMSALKMMTPASGIEGIKKFVIDTVISAGGKPCPPIIIGIGIGGNFEKSAILAKEAIFRPLEDEAKDPIDNALEKELLSEINKLNIGPMALGGNTTCLAVKVNSYPCHIASMPVAINLQCHSARKSHIRIKGEHI